MFSDTSFRASPRYVFRYCYTDTAIQLLLYSYNPSMDTTRLCSMDMDTTRPSLFNGYNPSLLNGYGYNPSWIQKTHALAPGGTDPGAREEEVPVSGW
jgi:hypothetical protein